MPFDFNELMNEHFPTEPKVGEWWSVGRSLPNEYDEVLFLVDDGSAEGRCYFGYRERNKFVVQYEFTKFKIGGHEGVAFWSPVQSHSKVFAATCP